LTRVRDRVRVGGHHIPEVVVRRRFKRGVNNLFRLYVPLLDSWLIFDNSGTGPKMVAFGFSDMHVVFEPEVFREIEREVRIS
jgi:predicted ABC-type ATPase